MHDVRNRPWSCYPGGLLPTRRAFLMADCGRPTDLIVKWLRERKVFIQPGSNWGMPTFIRVSVGTAADNRVFLEVLREVVGPAGAGGRALVGDRRSEGFAVRAGCRRPSPATPHRALYTALRCPTRITSTTSSSSMTS